MTESTALNYDALRARAFEAVILNMTDVPHVVPTEFPARLEEQRAEVRRTLNEDLSQWIKNAARILASAWPRPGRPSPDSRDRIVDAAQL
jgi:hypothetical protein